MMVVRVLSANAVASNRALVVFPLPPLEFAKDITGIVYLNVCDVMLRYASTDYNSIASPRL